MGFADFQRKTNLTWRALRLASRTDLRHFAALAKERNVHVLVNAIQGPPDRSAAVNNAADAATDDEGEDGPKSGVDPSVAVQLADDAEAVTKEVVAHDTADASIEVNTPASGPTSAVT